jgi:hypothetical protein
VVRKIGQLMNFLKLKRRLIRQLRLPRKRGKLSLTFKLKREENQRSKSCCRSRNCHFQKRGRK